MKPEASLHRMLAGRRVVVALSGGVDSTVLLHAAVRACGASRVHAVTAHHTLIPLHEYQHACSIAKRYKVKHTTLTFPVLRDPVIALNRKDRCYCCKKKLFSLLAQKFPPSRGWMICDGENADDKKEERPGSRAALEYGIRRPLQECGWRKKDIRHYAKKYNIPEWNKPASPCLATRFSYNTKLSKRELARVYRGELFLQSIGFALVRLRSQGKTVRVEVSQDQVEKLLMPQMSMCVRAVLHRLGWRRVVFVRGGYRMRGI